MVLQMVQWVLTVPVLALVEVLVPVLALVPALELVLAKALVLALALGLVLALALVLVLALALVLVKALALILLLQQLYPKCIKLLLDPNLAQRQFRQLHIILKCRTKPQNHLANPMDQIENGQ